MFPQRLSFAPLLFVALWLLWLLLPSTRDAAKNHWKARLQTTPTTTPYGVSVSKGDSSRDAVFVDALSKSGSTYAPGQNDSRWQALEQVGRRFPDDAAICAAQILAMSSHLHLGQTRQVGPSSSADRNWSVKLTKVESPAPELLTSFFAATARGAKLELNNNFWDWAQVIGLLAARRDSEVWPVLRAARTKTSYDDHVNEGALARLRLGKQQQGTMPPIQQIGISASTLFPHYATMREAARQISDNASGLRLSGERSKQTQALEGLRDFALMAQTMRRESKSFIGSLVGTAIEAIALSGGSYSPLQVKGVAKPRVGATLQAYATNPFSLSLFARQLGRNDIDTQLGNQWAEMSKWRAKTRGAAANSLFIGLDERSLFLAQAGDWLGSLLVAGIPTLLAVAVTCSLMLYFVPSWRRENQTRPTILSWAWGGLLGMVALLVLSSAAIWSLYAVTRTAGYSALDLLLAPIYSSSGSINVPLTWQYHFPALVGVFAALWLASGWDARRRGQPTLGARLRGLFHAPDDGIARFDVAPLLLLAFSLALIFLLIAGASAFLTIPAVNEDYESLHNYAGLCLFGLAVILLLPWLLRLRNPQGRSFALILVRRFAWGQLIFLTLAWGLLLMLSAPASRRFDAEFVRQQQIGEFQLIRKQVGL